MGFEVVCCRICLIVDFSGQSLFEEYNGNDLPDIIRNISGISVFAGDGLPPKICYGCAELLSEAHRIRSQCMESDTILRSQLSAIPKDQSTLTDALENDSHLQNPVLWSQEAAENESLGNYQQSGDSQDLKQALDKYLDCSDPDGGQIQEINHKHEMESDCNEGCSNVHEDDDECCSDDGSYTGKSDSSEPAHMQCKFCPKKFSNKVAFKRHYNYHIQEKTKCPICPREFSHKSNLKRHLSVHKDKHELICDKCGDVFMETKDLYEHLKSHNKVADDDKEEYVLECEECSHRTASLATHLAHVKNAHNIEDQKPFKCHICEMRFASKQGMYRHIDNIHENNRRNLRNRDKNFLCNTCGKKFYTNFHLEVHIRSHTGERPFKCQYCEKSFSQLSGLKMHTFIHTGEKPFACKICGKKFNQYGHVREHLLTHSGERPHVCKVCNHSFRVKGNLTAHMMIHTGKKPFTCSLCGKGFTQRAKLKAHLDKNHSGADDGIKQNFKVLESR